MSFHGGLAGVALAMWIFARKRGPVRRERPRRHGDTDRTVPRRLSNFTNAELYGRVTSFLGHGISRKRRTATTSVSLRSAEGLVLGAVMLLGWRRGWLGELED